MFNFLKKESINVCIIDDSSQIINLERKWIAKICPHANILSFLFSKHCLRYFEHGRPLPDVVICDVYMPEIDGTQMYDFFKSVGFAGRFYFLTSLSSGASELLAQCPDAKLFTKPFTKDTIKQILEDCPVAR